MLSDFIANFIIVYTSVDAPVLNTTGKGSISDMLELHPITSSVAITSIITSLLLLL